MKEAFTWNTDTYTVCRMEEACKVKAQGVYVFAFKRLDGWVPLYVGQTQSFAERLPDHEQWEEAQRLGATHVIVAAISSDVERDYIEAELIREYQPPLNRQLR